jgi:uncharacterized membrane protein
VDPNQPEFPAAPPITMPPGPPRQPMDNALRLVITLMFVNLGLSVVLTLLMLIFHNSIINYEFARTQVPAGSDPAVVRNALQDALWGRVAGVVIVSALYVWRSFSLRAGKRGAYLRLIWICVIGLAGILYLLAGAKYPVWMRVEQVLQGIVLISLLITVTRKPVRDRFAKQKHA